MHVILAIVRQIKVKHVADIGYVQAARGDVSGNQYRHIAVVKIAHHLQALGLRHITGQGLRDEAVGRQRPLEQFGDVMY